MKRVLVTGGLGFIGSHTVDLLVRKGHDVVVLDNRRDRSTWACHPDTKIRTHSILQVTSVTGSTG